MRDPGALAELPAVEVRTFPMSPAEHQFNSAWLRKE